MKQSIDIKEVATITISGPVCTGKSIVMHRIKQMLENEFDCVVASRDLKNEMKVNDYSKLEDWQKEMVMNTVWYLQEVKKPQ